MAKKTLNRRSVIAAPEAAPTPAAPEEGINTEPVITETETEAEQSEQALADLEAQKLAEQLAASAAAAAIEAANVAAALKAQVKAAETATLVAEGEAVVKRNLALVEAEKAAARDLITVTVPVKFHLTLDTHDVVQYQPGVQEMPRTHAEHWYAKANGVVVYQKQGEAAKE